MNLLNRLEKSFGRYAIRDLMKYIVILNFAVYLINMIYPEGHLTSWLFLSPAHILRGQIWRLFTFILIPPDASALWILFTLYLYYMIGSALEGEWGSFKFNIYYLTGMIGTIIAGFLTSGVITTAIYLNMSLFLAFAYFYPNYEFLLFFSIPVKVKYLALLDVLLLLSSFFSGNLTSKMVIVAALGNFLLFFGKDMFSGAKIRKKVTTNRRKFKDNSPKVIYFYRCTICGATEKSHPNKEFRYCAQCEGHHAYCMEHLFNHEHIKEE